jgi:hypothetical protein
MRDDIRSVILIQRPLNLDAACTLALLQEEALEHGHCREFKRSDQSTFSKYPAHKGALPLPPPPPRPAAVPPGDDKKLLEEEKQFQRPSADDRLSTLRANRKARGLCVHCGDKWALGHKCAPDLQLHVLQEVWDICHQDFSEDTSSDSGGHTSTEKAFMLLSASVLPN